MCIRDSIFIGLMLDWIKDDMREDPQQIVDRLARLDVYKRQT